MLTTDRPAASAGRTRASDSGVSALRIDVRVEHTPTSYKPTAFRVGATWMDLARPLLSNDFHGIVHEWTATLPNGRRLSLQVELRRGGRMEWWMVAGAGLEGGTR